jgi:D-amino-acid dehydrogenase
MRVLVMGAGVVGVTAAWQLLEDGHEVTVIDRQAEAASETSFANAGLVAPGHAFAWASPKAATTLLKSLFRKDQPLRFRLSAEPAFWRWSLQFLAQCTSERARRNTRIKHRLCRYSQAALQDVVARTGIAYDGMHNGVLYLHRSQASLDRGAANMQILEEAGQELEVVDRERAAAIDPALAASKDKIAGAIYGPNDESGDACKFTRALAALCAERGARFRYRTTIRAIAASGERVERVVTDRGEERADAYMLACGSYSPLLTRAFGERLPVYPVKGYSVTVPVDGANNPPTVGGIDEDNLCAYVRLGDRVRSTSVAEFAGYDTSHTPADFRSMLSALEDLFPSGGDYTRPQYWACLRPMTPEGTPVLGRGRLANLWYNTGHGHMGWTMACGTARLCADLIGGRPPDLPLEGLTLR